jgi:hypothetical protein
LGAKFGDRFELQTLSPVKIFSKVGVYGTTSCILCDFRSYDDENSGKYHIDNILDFDHVWPKVNAFARKLFKAMTDERCF